MRAIWGKSQAWSLSFVLIGNLSMSKITRTHEDVMLYVLQFES